MMKTKIVPLKSYFVPSHLKTWLRACSNRNFSPNLSTVTLTLTENVASGPYPVGWRG